MQEKETHLGAAYIAMICSALGWVTMGLLAIPGVIIAHTVKSSEPSTAAAIKSAFRVGYSAILLGVAGLATLLLEYLGLISRLRDSLGWADAGYADQLSHSDLFFASGLDERMITKWLWAGGIFVVTAIVLVLMLPLIRKAYSGFQSARILRSNSTR